MKPLLTAALPLSIPLLLYPSPPNQKSRDSEDWRPPLANTIETDIKERGISKIWVLFRQPTSTIRSRLMAWFRLTKTL
jgi:hypothetical protein